MLMGHNTTIFLILFRSSTPYLFSILQCQGFFLNIWMSRVSSCKCFQRTKNYKIRPKHIIFSSGGFARMLFFEGERFHLLSPYRSGTLCKHWRVKVTLVSYYKGQGAVWTRRLTISNIVKQSPESKESFVTVNYWNSQFLFVK